MSLVAHLVRKDLALLRAPAGVWAGFVVASTALFAGTTSDAPAAGALWADGLALALQLVMIVERLFAALIVAMLVLEDAPAGDRAFWPTRPIAGGRLLIGKLVSATVLLVLLPLAGLLPVWIWVGREAGLVASAVMEFVGTQATTIAFAAMVAALTRSLPQMMWVAAVVAVLLALAPALGGAMGADDLLMETRRQRWAAMEGAVVVTIVVVLVHQFRTRHTRRSWTVLAAGLLGVVGVGVAWRGELPRRTLPPVPKEARVTLGLLEGKVGGVIPAEQQRDVRVPALQVAVTAEADGARFLVPVGGRGTLSAGAGAPVAVMLTGKPLLQAGVALRPWQPGGAEPLVWPVRVRRVASEPAVLDAGPLRWTGELRLAEYEREFALELPLAAEATVQAGSNRLRVLELQRATNGELSACLIEERDLWRPLDVTVVPGSMMPLDGRSAVLDAYLLRSASGVRVLATDQLGAAVKQSVVRGVVKVTLPRDLPAAEIAGAVLVKVRFARGRAFGFTRVDAVVDVRADKEKS